MYDNPVPGTLFIVRDGLTGALCHTGDRIPALTSMKQVKLFVNRLRTTANRRHVLIPTAAVPVVLAFLEQHDPAEVPAFITAANPTTPVPFTTFWYYRPDHLQKEWPYFVEEITLTITTLSVVNI
jgi:hypothetical protein